MTDHYLVICTLNVFLRSAEKTRRVYKDRQALTQQPYLRQQFVQAFKRDYAQTVDAPDSVSGHWSVIKDAFRAAESEVLQRAAKPNKPWIRKETMDLIELRALARLANDEGEVKRQHNLVRRSVKEDRSPWMEDALAAGS